MQMIRKTFVLWLVLASMVVYAAPSSIVSPTESLQKTLNGFIASLNKNYAAIKANPKIAHRLVRRLVLPTVDLNGMARSVVGRKVWVSATKAQRKRFKKVFFDLVIRTYERAFVDYRYEKAKVYKVRGGYKGKRRVRVHSTIIRRRASAVDLTYRMVLKGKRWKIYDLSVEGISLIQSYRSQFSGPLAKDGIEGLIKEIKQRRS